MDHSLPQEAGPSRLAKAAQQAGMTERRRRRQAGCGCLAAKVAALASLLVAVQAQSASFAPSARWGAASALLNGQLIVHGGKTNGDSPGGGGFTYASGPNTADVLTLDLSQSFATSAAPWQSANSSSSSQAQPPSIAFHSLTPLGDSKLLLFGGQPDSTEATQSGNDSIYFVTLSTGGGHVSWSRLGSNKGEPERRMHHAAGGDGQGHIWIAGGQSTSGSMATYDEFWSVNANAANPDFAQSAAPPPSGIVDSTLTMLDDGSLLSLGGVNANGALQSFEMIAAYSTASKRWITSHTQGANSSSQGYPAPRRGHVAVALPNKRVFVHGGGTAELASAMDDAWILDWNQNPPVWSSIVSDGNGPGARFGHSAVAYGRKVAVAFGWAANNPADAELYVFDATDMVQTSNGLWTGGRWTTAYAPDSSAAKSGSGTGGQTNSGDGGNSGSGSSKNTGNSAGNGDSNTGTQDPFGAPTSPNTGSDSNGNSGSSSTGTKAGAVLGSLVGLGLVAGVGFYAYRRHQQSHVDDWRRGEGDAVLLGGSNHYSGPDELYTLEKGLNEPAFGDEYRPGMHPIGPREPSRANLSSSPWSLGNIGHAMEGSGPHLRQRLALFTGIGLGASQSNQQRFDMLADELDDGTQTEAFAMRHRNGDHLDDDDEDEVYADTNRHLRERSYGRVDQEDWDELTYGDLGAVSGRGQIDTYVRSPFEDEKERKNSAGPGGAAALYGDYLGYDNHSQADVHSIAESHSFMDPQSGSSQSHANVSSSNPSAPSSVSKGSAAQIVSFSDAPSEVGRRRSSGGGGVGPSPLVRRSPTWWDRFMGQNFLERSASGRLLPGPRAEEPIRDPTQPPALDAIRESLHSADPSAAESPFADGEIAEREMLSTNTADELGRRTDEGKYATDTHNRSLSSLQSARTADTTMLEARMRTMDVQRAGTISSHRTYGSSRSDRVGSTGGSMSSNGLSRTTSLRDAHPTPSDSTPGSIVWDPSQWERGNVPRTVYEQDEGEVSRDIADTSDSERPELPETSEIIVTSTAHQPLRAMSDASRNPDLSTPVSLPFRGSVKDRALAIERKWTQEGPAAVLPIPRSPVAVGNGSGSGERLEPSPLPEQEHTFVPGRGGKPILTKLSSPNKTAAKQESTYAPELVTSPVNIKTPSASMHSSSSANAPRFTHGLVPKAQLYVANPDKRSGSSASGGS